MSSKSSLPNDITNFLPNDDITDLMLMSRTFNAHVTPRLKKIDQEMATMNQSIKSLVPSPAPEASNHEWISQMDLKGFEPIGSKEVFRCSNCTGNNLITISNKSSLPNDIFYNVTNFLPNDDITDLMLMSRTVNALVTPRLRKLDEEMATLNQSIKSFMPIPPPETDDEWISQLNLKKFEPVGSAAKKRMMDAFHKKNDSLRCNGFNYLDSGQFDRLKERMSLQRFNNLTFFGILGALVATPKFRQEYNISRNFAHSIACFVIQYCYFGVFNDVVRIWSFYNSDWSKLSR
ncbi:hypothetical protein DdX_16402 [Ditylenchus destructor]|uniref:F-box domain-containing protein n=1 Tax=Ditylenchus destructor TaxID=166010 RepID=A0AAD4MQG8_9BILA|nr:hypothetical protein DdX_16402 [Ditylenchus destructor]